MNATTTALLAYDARKRIVDGVLDAREAQACRVKPVAATHGAYQTIAMPSRPLRNPQLLRHGVDGVYHVVGAGKGVEDIRETLLGEKSVRCRDASLGIDVSYDPAHDVRLRETDGGVEGHGLSIDVGGSHYVAVEKHESSHATARKRLGAVGTHAAKADDQDRRPIEPSQTLVAEDEAKPVVGAFGRTRHP